MFDEYSDGSGAVTRYDQHGTNHLTDVNTTPSTTGKFSVYGADFSRSLSEHFYINDNAALSPTSEVSMSVWVKLKSCDASGYNSIFQKGDTFYSGSDARGGAYALTYNYFTSTDWRLRAIVVDSAGSTRDVTTNQNFYSDVGSWVHIVMTFSSANQIRIYRNGSSLTFASATGSITNIRDSSEVLGIGAAKYNGSLINSQDGVFSHMVLWNRELTSAEVTELYNSGNGNPYPFVRYAPLTPGTFAAGPFIYPQL